LPLPATTPGSHRSTGSDSDNRPSATNCSTAVDTNVLVTLPARRNGLPGTGRVLSTSATPLRAA
jgi:hypothetical protein